jgi:sterol desaturase/sphingolipid hydroxylase (fatty acid hydroxylase superfamily)
MAKLIIKTLYLPFFLLLGNGLSIYIVEQDYTKLYLAILIVGFIGVSFFIERIMPYDSKYNEPQSDRARDFLHALFNESISIIGLLSVPFIIAVIPTASIWPSELPTFIQLIIAILIADIGISLVHYASHKNTLLWKFHAVHHSVKRMYGFNGLMKHPIHQIIETLAGVAPLIILGIPQDIISLLLVAVILQLLLQHSNVKYYTGALRYILAINKLHRFHHLNTAKEGNVNFGLFTTFTDHLLRTYFFDEKRIIKIKDLGIRDRPNYPVKYFDQIVEPFRNNRIL